MMEISIAPKTLDRLPLEIIQAFAEHLDGGSLLVLTTTTRRLREACNDTVVWKSMIRKYSMNQIESRAKIFSICGQNCRPGQRYGLALSRTYDPEYDPATHGLSPEDQYVDALTRAMLYAPHLKLLGCELSFPASIARPVVCTLTASFGCR